MSAPQAYTDGQAGVRQVGASAPRIEFQHSEQIDAIAAALVKAEAAMDEADADSLGRIETPDGERTYHYANLASIRKVVRKPLSKNGLAVVQLPLSGSRGEVRLTTILLHESGQWMAGTVSVPLPVPTPQGFGSALTYARRYALAAMLNVCVEDDDGAAASPPRAVRREQSAAARTGPDRRGDRPVHAAAPGANGHRPPASQPQHEQWREVPYSKAGENDLKAFARAYAESKGLESVSSDDIRRDFDVEGRLIDHFGDTPLGAILDSATSVGSDVCGAIRKPVDAQPESPATEADGGSGQ